jgi:hypothetical protein
MCSISFCAFSSSLLLSCWFGETTGKITNRFRRPNQHDSIWIEHEKVLYVLSEPPAKIGSRERSMLIVCFVTEVRIPVFRYVEKQIRIVKLH